MATTTADLTSATVAAAGVRRRLTTRLRLKVSTASLAVLAMVSGLGLVSAGTASAASTYYPITVNTANWTGSAGFGSRPPGLTVDSHGVIHLQGALRQTSTSGNADELGCVGAAPLCAWGPPGRTVYTIAHTLGGTYADLAIHSDGSIWLIPSPNTPIPDGFISLEGISYMGFTSGGGPITQLQLASNWYSYTPQYNDGASAASWWQDDNQTVHLSGGVQEITKTSGIQEIGWVPTSAAPWQGDVYTIVSSLGGTYADLDIRPDGSIWLLPSPNTNTGFVSLEGVTYSRLGPPGFHPFGPVNGWQANTSYGAAVPGWYKDPDGIVHLEGGYTGSGPGEIATIDPSAAPSTTVYTIVHAFGGSYADLEITSSGQIWVIAATGYVVPPTPTNPGVSAVTGWGYVSLDGVTYQQ